MKIPNISKPPHIYLPRPDNGEWATAMALAVGNVADSSAAESGHFKKRRLAPKRLRWSCARLAGALEPAAIGRSCEKPRCNSQRGLRS
jgi:hypothetical protein